MSNDPGFASDNCIFIEAISGDGGVRDTNAVWWLSPDITLTSPAASQSISLDVRVHRKPDTSGCHFPGDENLIVELWVANPSLVMAPIRNSAARVVLTGSPLPLEGNSDVQHIDWTPPPGLPADDPQSHGPKCFVARCYPDSLHPSPRGFFLPNDQHVAQHNLCVIATTGPAIAFNVNALSLPPPLIPIAEHAQIKLRAVLDLAPNQLVSNAVLQALNSITGFQHLRTASLAGGFKFDLSHLDATQIVDHSRPGQFPPTQPSFEARVTIGEKGPVPITFAATLKGVNSGEACIFHLTQVRLDNLVQGGLTLVVLKL